MADEKEVHIPPEDYARLLGARAQMEYWARAGNNVARGWVVTPPEVEPIAVFLGGGKYKVDETMISLTGAQADVLQALVELQGASLDELRTHSGAPNPAIALKQICKSHPLLSPFISLPGGKGKGGYSTTIRPAASLANN